MTVTIDPLSPWVTIQSARTDTDHWELTHYRYLPPELAGNDVNVYISVADEHGFILDTGGQPMMDVAKKFFLPIFPQVGITVMQHNGGDTLLRTKSDPAKLGEVDFNQSGDSSFDPFKGKVGPYRVSIKAQGLPSDMVVGMGLPLKRHAVYSLGFQRVKAGIIISPPPTVKDQLTAIIVELQSIISQL